jgi:hypothetical protein
MIEKQQSIWNRVFTRYLRPKLIDRREKSLLLKLTINGLILTILLSGVACQKTSMPTSPTAFYPPTNIEKPSITTTSSPIPAALPTLTTNSPPPTTLTTSIPVKTITPTPEPEKLPDLYFKEINPGQKIAIGSQKSPETKMVEGIKKTVWVKVAVKDNSVKEFELTGYKNEKKAENAISHTKVDGMPEDGERIVKLDNITPSIGLNKLVISLHSTSAQSNYDNDTIWQDVSVRDFRDLALKEVTILSTPNKTGYQPVSLIQNYFYYLKASVENKSSRETLKNATISVFENSTPQTILTSGKVNAIKPGESLDVFVMFTAIKTGTMTLTAKIDTPDDNPDDKFLCAEAISVTTGGSGSGGSSMMGNNGGATDGVFGYSLPDLKIGDINIGVTENATGLNPFYAGRPAYYRTIIYNDGNYVDNITTSFTLKTQDQLLDKKSLPPIPGGGQTAVSGNFTLNGSGNIPIIANVLFNFVPISVEGGNGKLITVSSIRPGPDYVINIPPLITDNGTSIIELSTGRTVKISTTIWNKGVDNASDSEAILQIDNKTIPALIPFIAVDNYTICTWNFIPGEEDVNDNVTVSVAANTKNNYELNTDNNRQSVKIKISQTPAAAWKDEPQASNGF